MKANRNLTLLKDASSISHIWVASSRRTPQRNQTIGQASTKRLTANWFCQNHWAHGYLPDMDAECTEAYGRCATSTGQKFEPKPQLRNLPLIIFVRTQTFLLRSIRSHTLPLTLRSQTARSNKISSYDQTHVTHGTRTDDLWRFGSILNQHTTSVLGP